MTRHEGRVLLISGAASEIGAAIARRFVDGGGFVVCADVDAAAAAALALNLGDRAVHVACDVTDADSARRCTEVAVSRFGRLDALLHNAAAPSIPGSVADLDLDKWRLELEVGLTGAFLMSKFAVPAIASSGGGSVVLVASQFGTVVAELSVAYCATKAGLIHLAKAMALDHARDNIRVNSLSPAAVWTRRLQKRWPDLESAQKELGPLHVLGRIAAPEEIASAADFLLSSESSFVTGTDFLVDGGYVIR